MESIFDRLPIPRSRPAWMASLLMFLLGCLFYWPFQSQLLNLHFESVYFYEYFEAYGSELEIPIKYPMYFSEGVYYPVEGRVQGKIGELAPAGNGELTLLFDFGGSLFSARQQIAISDLTHSAEFSQAVQFNRLQTYNRDYAILVAYYEAIPDPNLVRIEQPKLEYAGNYLHIREDRFMATLIMLVDSLIRQGNIYWVLLAFAAMAGWVMEDKNSQELWLSERSGWLAVRKIFLRALPIFFVFYLVLFALIAFTYEAKPILGGTAILILLYWFFKPGITHRLRKL